MGMPELQSFFGFPLRFGCFVIASIGLGLGGVGIASIIIFALAESIITNLVGTTFDASTKKVVLMSVGMSSIVLIAANTSLILGVFAASSNKVGFGKWITFLFVIMVLGGIVYPSLGCYLDKGNCGLVNDNSIEALIAINGALGLIAMVWLYFILTIHNYQELLL